MDTFSLQSSLADGVTASGDSLLKWSSACAEVRGLQSCAWFSAVDIDHVLRKEVNMDCITPSQPEPIPHGLSHDIEETLAKTAQGSLFADGRSMDAEKDKADVPHLSEAATATPSSICYRDNDLAFLRAQNAASQRDLRNMAPAVTGNWDSYAITKEGVYDTPRPASGTIKRKSGRPSRSKKLTNAAPPPVYGRESHSVDVKSTPTRAKPSLHPIFPPRRAPVTSPWQQRARSPLS